MSTVLCQTVGMDGLQLLLRTVSPQTTMCVRGRHAVGKSEAVYQSASQVRSDFYKDPENCARVVKALGGEVRVNVGGKIKWVTEWSYDMGIPVVERRLSQMTEGDIIGLPEMKNVNDGVNSWRSTAFRPCDWLIQSCQFPVMLFLDERNRAIQGVKQAVFQLADSKVFYGHKIHDESRIVVAENVGESYQVEQNDPAEVSRWVTVELEPSFEEWIKWAEDKCHPATIEFIRANPKALEHTQQFEADKKYPDRRTWYKLDQELQRLELLDADNPNQDNLLYLMSGGFLGTEWGTKFTKFVRERDREIKAEDILADWKKAKKKLQKGSGHVANEQYVEAVHKLGDWTKKEKNKLKKKQAIEFAKFMYDCPPEPCMAAWALLQQNTENLFAVHPYIEKLMVARASGQDVTNLPLPAELEDSGSKGSFGATSSGKSKTKKSTTKKESEQEQEAPKSRKRGRRKS